MILAPIVEAMKPCVRASHKVHTDDTPITVLDPRAEPAGSRRGYLWVYIGERDDVVFDYTDSRTHDGPGSTPSPTSATCWIASARTPTPTSPN